MLNGVKHLAGSPRSSALFDEILHFVQDDREYRGDVSSS